MDQESLNASLVRIHTINGGVVGGGFLVEEHHVLTCAHVIAQALGLAETCVDPPLVSIVLDFPLLAARTRLAARVVLWCPVEEDGGGDIAVLELLGDPPTGARAVHFTPAEDVWEHPFRAFGFPAGHDDGVYASGRLLGRQANNWLLLEDIKTEGFAVAPGFSGGPVWDEQLQGVVGMVVAASRATETKTAFVIPFDVLKKAWPGIEPIPHQRVFLSSAPGDVAFAERLRADLKAQGIVVWDELNGPAHTNMEAQEHVQQAIRDAQAVLLIVSSQTRTSHVVKEHMRLTELYKRRLVVACVGDDERTRSQSADWRDTTWVDVQNTPYESALTHIEAALSQSKSLTELFESPKGDAEQIPRNPYKGLRPFTANDVEDFFGRERLVNTLVNDIATLLAMETPETERGHCLTIIGPSGSGKSSIVMAGLLPQLHHGVLPGSDKWVYLEPMIPGKHPIETLTRTLKPLFPDSSFKTLREDLEGDATCGLLLLATQLVKERGSKVVLLVDQFEEIFTQTEIEDERQRFIDLLLTAATAPSGPLLVLFTLRADFYDRPMQYPFLSRLIQAHQRQVLPMEVEDLRATVEQPADLPDVQLSFEGNLVGDLLFEMQGQVGALPLLQFTLDQLFERRDGHRLTLQAYREIGGIKGALSQHAEKTYAALPSDDHRRTAQTLFLRLMEPGDSEQETTRRRAALSELTSHDVTQNFLMRETIDTFVAARLLIGNETAGTTTLEVSHEAVLREWKRLGDWQREAHDDIRFQQALRRDVTEWDRRKQPRDRLYHGAQFKEAQAWAERNKPSEQEIGFLQASATQQTFALMRLMVVGLLLLLSLGMGGWYFVTRPPDPTRVTTLLDNKDGSLRYCIERAHSGSTITFDKSLKGTIRLKESLEFPSDEQLTIRGPGADHITITGGNDTNAHIEVSPHAIADISGLSFKNSKTFVYPFLINEGTLTVNNSVIENNKTSAGAVSYGGGIYNSGTLTVIDSLLSNNIASGEENGLGGGIDNYGRLTVINSTFLKNRAFGSYSSPGYGGGILNYKTGTAMVEASTFSDNVANGDTGGIGGGIANGGKLTVVNSTFLKNTAHGSNSSPGYGGGITNYDDTGIAIIRFSTFYQNASRVGGGIWTDPTKNSQMTISGSIVAENSAQDGPDIAGVLSSEGYNLIEKMTGANGLSSTDKQVASANLKIDSTLHNNGGPTQTLKLLPGSKALDAIHGDACTITITDASGHTKKITTDQRGSPRLHGSKHTCDIGAI